MSILSNSYLTAIVERIKSQPQAPKKNSLRERDDLKIRKLILLVLPRCIGCKSVSRRMKSRTINSDSKCSFLMLAGILSPIFGVKAQEKIGPEFRVSTNTVSSQTNPAVTSFSNGDFVVVWEDDGAVGVYGQLFASNGTKLGTQFLVNTYVPSSQRNACVARLRDDSFVVTWDSENQDGSLTGVFGQIFTQNGTKIGGEFGINTFTGSYQRNSAVSSLADNNFVVAWTSSTQDGSNDGVYGQLFAGNSTKLAAEFLVNNFTTLSQNNPSSSSFENGNFVVTWDSDSQDGDSSGVYGQLFSENGTRLGPEFLTNTFTASAQRHSSVASNINSNYIVTWESLNQLIGGWDIYGQRFISNGTRLGNEFRINTYLTMSQNHPSIAGLSNGNFVVVWDSQDQDGSSTGVYGQMFADEGLPVGNEFRVNSYTLGAQRFPSVAGLENGKFVVTWESLGQDGGSWGVYGQIMGDNITQAISTGTSGRMITSASTGLLPSSSSTAAISTALGFMTTFEHFSTTSVVAPTSSRTNDVNYLWLWVTVAAVGSLVCFASLTYYLFRRRSSNSINPSSSRSKTPSQSDDNRAYGTIEMSGNNPVRECSVENEESPDETPLGPDYANFRDPKKMSSHIGYGSIPTAASDGDSPGTE